ncbi:MAG: response regulator transcription factor [Cyanobacteria bacterium]|nr:response regulator transcription factor [Cyanobacteriota bacterium]
MTRLLLLEDEPDLGAALQRVLERERYVVDWVTEGDAAEAYLDRWSYGVGIFDWMVPGRSGLDLCRHLRQRGSSMPVLILTARDRLGDRVEGLDAGADDYLIKPFGMAELLARLRALLRRAPHQVRSVLVAGPLRLDPATAILTYQSQGPSATVERTAELTAKELQLLELLMTHPGQIVSRDALLDRLWEAAAEPSSNVVAAQVRLLRRKLALLGCDRAIETVYGLGYRFRPPEPEP